MKKLFVGNLPYKTTSADLRDMFSKNGEVSEADAAIEMWNGKDIEGRALTVNEARPKEDRSQGGFRRAA